MFRGLYSDRLVKLASRGHLGYPVVTIAFYGPDDTRASKLVISVLPNAKEEEALIDGKKWFSETRDLRDDGRLAREALALIANHDAKTVVMPPTIIGCPHEEGKDYPDGEVCPQCRFWVGRDRFAGISGLADDE